MLHGIREGVIGFDAKQRITLINDEARRLLRLSGTADRRVDRRGIPARPAARRARPVRLEGADQSILTDDSLLVVNRNPVVVAGRDVGSVVTLRDRTELESLVRELHAMTGLANALRAQEHEFTNRLHVIAGLIDLGEFEEASRFVTSVAQNHLASAEDLRARIAPPVVAALLLAKLSVAAEREIDLVITPTSHLEVPDGDAQSLMTIIGNLIDNAMEAVAAQPAPRTITVHLQDDDEIRIVVVRQRPRHPGRQPSTRSSTDGYSTKSPRGHARRGLGLALVQRLVHRAGGTITVACRRTAPDFEVRMPLSRTAVRARQPVTAERRP